MDGTQLVQTFDLTLGDTFNILNCSKHNGLLTKTNPSRDQIVILQDSVKILQKNAYLVRSAREIAILQNSCKFVPVELSSYWLSFMQHN